ncbi:MAG: biopolymer transporter ExbD [Candidatus Cloacimonetes bacterium]|jgi:biopolymer transport protein ExbD|nr:biopolymer transporter ExbD [Candidatus Cloacimonadota bacterium]
MNILSVKVNRAGGGKFQSRKRGNKTKDLNITSLIDILTILLVFMIKNISMDSTQKNAPEGMLLPTVVTTNDLIESGKAVYLKIYPDKILYGTESMEVGSVQDFLNRADIRNSLLRLLQMEARAITSSNSKPCLLIQADKDLPCLYITEFIKFSAQASFANIYFSAIHTDDKDEVLGL